MTVLNFESETDMTPTQMLIQFSVKTQRFAKAPVPGGKFLFEMEQQRILAIIMTGCVDDI